MQKRLHFVCKRTTSGKFRQAFTADVSCNMQAELTHISRTKLALTTVTVVKIHLD